MGLDQDAAFLEGIPLFRHFDADQIKLIVFSAQRRSFAAGSMLYRQNDRASSAMVVVSGDIEAYRGEGESQEILGRFGPGTILGETAMIVETKRGCSVRAVNDVEAIAVSRSVFRRVLDEYPRTAERIHAAWAQRLHETMQEISALSPRFAVGEES